MFFKFKNDNFCYAKWNLNNSHWNLNIFKYKIFQPSKSKIVISSKIDKIASKIDKIIKKFSHFEWSILTEIWQILIRRKLTFLNWIQLYFEWKLTILMKHFKFWTACVHACSVYFEWNLTILAQFFKLKIRIRCWLTILTFSSIKNSLFFQKLTKFS